MPIIKPVTSKKPAIWIQKYLEDEGRALSLDLFNLRERDPLLGSWGNQMDIWRQVNGGDRWGGRPRPTYKHYVFSPDPDDDCDLATLRAITREWVEAHFVNTPAGEDYQVACIPHCDNTNGVLHMHVIVNYTNVTSIKNDGNAYRLQLDDDKVAELNQSLQDMSARQGLSPFSNTYDHEVIEALDDKFSPVQDSSRFAPRIINHHEHQKHPDSYVSELKALSTGRSWKEQIAHVVELAYHTSPSESRFIGNCRSLGVEVLRAKDGDYLFCHPAGGSKKCKGANLDRNSGAFSAKHIRASFITKPQTSIYKTDTDYRVAVLRSCDKWWERTTEQLMQDHVYMLDAVGGTKWSLRDIGHVAALQSKHGIVSYSDYVSVISTVHDTYEKNALVNAYTIAKELGLFKAPIETSEYQTDKRSPSHKTSPRSKPLSEMTREEKQALYWARETKRRQEEGKERNKATTSSHKSPTPSPPHSTKSKSKDR